MSCFNHNCSKDALNSINMIVVNVDGDVVCDSKCQESYEQQKAHFFNHVVHNEESTTNWLLGMN